MTRTILIMISILLAAILIPFSHAMEAIEEIDQQQPEHDASSCLLGSMVFAQSFKPSMNTLTKVELLMNKFGDLFGTSTLSIRASLTGEDLTIATVESLDITSELEWIEFDFEDIDVSPDESYYILLTPDPDSDGGEEFQSINWAFAWENMYQKGNPFLRHMGSWSEGIPGHASADYTFKTYGSDEQSADPVEITITAGNFNMDIGRGVTINTLNYRKEPVIIDYSIIRDRYFVNDFPETYTNNFTVPGEKSWVSRIGIGNEFIIYNLEISAWFEDVMVERTGIAIGETVILF